MTVESLLAEVKLFGRFQLLMTVLVQGSKLPVSWSMIQMAFAGVQPDWWCLANSSSSRDNTTFKYCPANRSACEVVFATDKRTIISQWALICDKAWIADIIISIQMVGVGVGAAASGQIADRLGRKWTHYVGLFTHAGLNMATGFSSSWQAFAACRFLIGMMIGSLMVTSFTYTIEFTGPKARAALPWLPAWNMGVCLFALVGWRTQDWAYLHFTLAAVHLPFMAACLFTPESLRWLLVRGRLSEAKQCLAIVARWNGVPVPMDSEERLTKIAAQMTANESRNRKTTYLDLFRQWSTTKTTLLLAFIWITLSIVYHGINFSARNFAGNLYLNIFMLTVVEMTAAIPTIFLCNKIGRRWTSALCFFLTCAAALGILVAYQAGSNNVQAIRGLAMVAKVGTGAGFSTIVTLTSESYPTSIRALGLGAANSATRIGGILAPFVINMDNNTRLVISYVISAVLSIVSGIFCLLVEETRGKDLKDSLSEKRPLSDTPLMVDQTSNEAEDGVAQDGMALSAVSRPKHDNVSGKKLPAPMLQDLQNGQQPLQHRP